jgi:hypothetical protein
LKVGNILFQEEGLYTQYEARWGSHTLYFGYPNSVPNAEVDFFTHGVESLYKLDEYFWLEGPTSPRAVWRFRGIDPHSLNERKIFGTLTAPISKSPHGGYAMGGYYFLRGPLKNSLSVELFSRMKSASLGRNLTSFLTSPAFFSSQKGSEESTTVLITITNPTTGEKREEFLSIKSGEPASIEIPTKFVDEEGKLEITLTHLHSDGVGVKSGSLNLSYAMERSLGASEKHYISADEYIVVPGFKTNLEYVGVRSYEEVLSGEDRIREEEFTWSSEGFDTTQLDLESQIRIELSRDGGVSWESWTSSPLSTYRDFSQLKREVESSIYVNFTYDPVSDTFLIEARGKDITHIRLTDLGVSGSKKGFFEYTKLNPKEGSFTYEKAESYDERFDLYWIGVDTNLAKIERKSFEEVHPFKDRIDVGFDKFTWEEQGFKIKGSRGLDMKSRVKITLEGGTKPGVWLSEPLHQYNDLRSLISAIEGALDVEITYNPESDTFKIEPGDPTSTSLKLEDVNVREGLGFFEYTKLNETKAPKRYLDVEEDRDSNYGEWRFRGVEKDKIMKELILTARAPVWDRWEGVGGKPSTTSLKVEAWNPVDRIWEEVGMLKVGYEKEVNSLGTGYQTHLTSSELKLSREYVSEDDEVKVRLSRTDNKFVGISQQTLELKIYEKQPNLTFTIGRRERKGVWRSSVLDYLV